MEIAVNRPAGKTAVNASAFGLSPQADNNAEAIRAAFAWCKTNGTDILEINPGVYRFCTNESMVLDHVRNLTINGNGAEFVFSGPGHFKLAECETVLLRDLFIDWDWNTYRLADLIMVEAADPAAGWIEASFLEPGGSREGVIRQTMPYGHWTFNRFDPQFLTPGMEDGAEAHWLTSELISPALTPEGRLRVEHKGALSYMRPGETYLLRYRTYGSNAFHLEDCRHITLERVTVWSIPGMAFQIGGGDHFCLRDCHVGIKPNTIRRVSATADALHMADTGGYLVVEGCDFSFMGDDCINIHDNLSYVLKRLDNRTVRAEGSMHGHPGDEIAFRLPDYTLSGFTARIISVEREASRSFTITFDRGLPEEFNAHTIFYCTKFNSGNYIIRDCYFHENRARALLLQSGDGLVEHNRFYKTMAAAILIIADVAPGLWAEGTGADRIEIRDNTFKDCNVNDCWSPLIHMNIMAFGVKRPATAFHDISIRRNRFYNFPSEAMEIRCGSGIVIEDNLFLNPSPRRREKTVRGHIDVQNSTNITVRDNVWIASDACAPVDPVRLDAPAAATAILHNNIVKERE